MKIAQYLPTWLRSRVRKPAPQNVAMLNKKERQILPKLPKTGCVPVPLKNDRSGGYHLLWRL